MLRRKYARLCTVLLVLTCVCISAPWLMFDVLGQDPVFWGSLGLGGAVICFTIITIIRFRFLRCPSCGRGLAAARWNAGKRQYCSCCGKPFRFDDEPEELEE